MAVLVVVVVRWSPVHNFYFIQPLLPLCVFVYMLMVCGRMMMMDSKLPADLRGELQEFFAEPVQRLSEVHIYL